MGATRIYTNLSKSSNLNGVDALFVEVHDKPDMGKSEVANMLSLEGIPKLLPLLMKIDNLIKESNHE